MPDIELKPCPFCGTKGKAKIESRKRDVWRNDFGDAAYYRTYHVRCTVCNARGATVGGLTSPTICGDKVVKMYGKETVLHPYAFYRDKAVEAWNRRCREWLRP